MSMTYVERLLKRPRYWLLTFIVLVLFSSILAHRATQQKTPIVLNTSKQNASIQPRVFTPDWGVGAMLTALDTPPVAIGSKHNYQKRFNSPKLPSLVKNIGHKYQPNLELLAQLHPDIIMYTKDYRLHSRFYDPSIPIIEVRYASDGQGADNSDDRWQSMTEATRDMGHLLGQKTRAERHIKYSKQRIEQAGDYVKHHLDRRNSGQVKVIIIELVDARVINVYTEAHPVRVATDMMGLTLISPSHRLGNHTVTLSIFDLHHLYQSADNICLILVEPSPMMAQVAVAKSPIWQRSPFFKTDACFYRIDPVWSYGGIEVLVTFAENFKRAVANQNHAFFQAPSFQQWVN